MSKKAKAVNRLQLHPKDFTYDEARSLLGAYGFVEDNKGRTSGSRVMFVNKTLDRSFRLHKPHPGNILKGYQVKELAEFVESLEE